MSLVILTRVVLEEGRGSASIGGNIKKNERRGFGKGALAILTRAFIIHYS